MKISCDQCQAQYNVDETQIPGDGLEFQCSQCSSAVFVPGQGAQGSGEAELFELGNTTPLGSPGSSDLPLDLNTIRLEAPPASGRKTAPPAPEFSLYPSGGGGSPSTGLSRKPAPAFDQALPDLGDLGADPEAMNPGGLSLTPSNALPDLDQGSSPPTPAREGELFDFLDAELGAHAVPAAGAVDIRYRIRRKSGKIFGPFDVATVNQMLKEHQLMGNEDASTDGKAYRALGAFPEFTQTMRALMNETEGGPDLPQDLSLESELEGPEGEPASAAKAAAEDDDEVAIITPSKDRTRRSSGIHTIRTQDAAAAIPAQDPGRVSEVLPKPESAPEEEEAAPAKPKRNPLSLLFKRGKTLSLKGLSPRAKIIAGATASGIGLLGVLLVVARVMGPSQTPPAQTSPIANSSQLPALEPLLAADSIANYQKIAQAFGPLLSSTQAGTLSVPQLYQGGLALATLLREEGPNPAFQAQAQQVLGLLKGRSQAANEAKKIEAALTLISKPAEVQKTLAGLVPEGRDAEAFWLAALAAERTEQLPQAIELIGKAVEIDGKSPKLQHLLGLLRQKQGDFDGALAAFDQALTLRPEHAQSGLQAARILIENKRALAEGEKKLALLFGPIFQTLAVTDQAEAHALQASVHQQRDEIGKAVEQLDKAAGLSPRPVPFLLAAAQLRQSIGEIPRALAGFEDVLRREPGQLDALLGKASLIAKAGDIIQAGILLKAMVGKNPQDPRPNLALGLLSEQIEKLPEAAALYQKALGIKPDYTPARLALNRVRIRSGDTATAVSEMQQALQANPTEAGLRLGLGEALLSKRDPAGAERELREAIRLDEKLLPAYFLLANLLRDQQKLDETGQWLQKAEAIAPFDPRLIAEKAHLLVLQKTPEEAVRILEPALQKRPNDVNLLVRLGMALRVSGTLDKSLAQLEKARLADSTVAEVYFQLGLTLQEKKEWDKAVESFKQATYLDKNNAEIYHQIGVTHLGMEAYKDAVASFKQALEIDPDHMESVIELGKIYSARNQGEEAVRWLNRAALARPDRLDVVLALADVYTVQEHPSLALKILQKAYKKDPEYPGLSLRMGRAYDEMEKKPLAIQMYLKAAQNNGKDPLPHFYLGHAYKSLRKNKKAVEEFRQYLQLRPDAPDADEIREEIDYLKTE